MLSVGDELIVAELQKLKGEQRLLDYIRIGKVAMLVEWLRQSDPTQDKMFEEHD